MFCDLWSQLFPFVLIMRPATDLCWTCQKNNNLIQKTANLPEAERVEAVRHQEQHLRLFIRTAVGRQESVAQRLEGVDFSLRREPCSYNFSKLFLVAPQVTFPSSLMVSTNMQPNGI